MPRDDQTSALRWLKEVGLGKLRSVYNTQLGAMYHEDSINVLKAMPATSVDLVMTSPPFALTRQKEYGNEPIERYLAWLTPFCEEIYRILKPTGSFVLDIGGSRENRLPVRSM